MQISDVVKIFAVLTYNSSYIIQMKNQKGAKEKSEERNGNEIESEQTDKQMI